MDRVGNFLDNRFVVLMNYIGFPKYNIPGENLKINYITNAQLDYKPVRR